MRYAGWLATCPILLVTLVSLAAPLAFNAGRQIDLVPLLLCNILMILLGITAAITNSRGKWLFFGAGSLTGACAAARLETCQRPSVSC